MLVGSVDVALVSSTTSPDNRLARASLRSKPMLNSFCIAFNRKLKLILFSTTTVKLICYFCGVHTKQKPRKKFTNFFFSKIIYLSFTRKLANDKINIVTVRTLHPSTSNSPIQFKATSTAFTRTLMRNFFFKC